MKNKLTPITILAALTLLLASCNSYEKLTYLQDLEETRQNDILEQSQKIQTYNQTAQQTLQKRNMELIQPVYKHINQEISNIAGAQNFTYVLDVSAGNVAYISPESKDLTPLVLEAIKGK